MAFEKGQPRPANSGRKKGSLNKKTVARVADILAERDINPTEEILNLIHNGRLSDGEKLRAWFELQSYTQAKPKPLEEGEDDPGSDDRKLTASDILEIVDVTPKEIEEK